MSRNIRRSATALTLALLLAAAALTAPASRAQAALDFKL
jgi:hypothetical protein